MNSSIDYSQKPEGEIKNTYTLDGVLTGCSKQELNTLRDGLVRSFDWKENPSIISSININGVISSNEQTKIIPTSLDFESSNYVGYLGYSLKLEVFTGYKKENQEEEDLINKSHTETINIDEKGCVSVSTNISCTPNENLTGCNSIQKANDWIKKQLGEDLALGYQNQKNKER